MSFTWSTIFYLFLVFVAPLALVNQANAQEEDQTPLQKDVGQVIGIDLGTTYSYVSCSFKFYSQYDLLMLRLAVSV